MKKETRARLVALGFGKFLPKNIEAEEIKAIKAKLVALKIDKIIEPEAVDTTRELMALTMPSDKGVLETPYSDLMIGDPVLIEGTPAEDGDYTLEDGTVISVTDGLISNIVMAEEEEVDTEAMAQQVIDLTAQLAEARSENEELMAVLANAKLPVSKPPVVAKYTPRKNSNGVVVSIREQAKAEKEAYRKK